MDGDPDSPPGSPRDRHHRETALHVYADTWTQFYKWEAKYSRSIVRSLADKATIVDVDAYFLSDEVFGPFEGLLDDSDSDVYPFLVTVYDHDGVELPEGHVVNHALEINVVIPKPNHQHTVGTVSDSTYNSLPPYAAYQFCTPTAVNLLSVDMNAKHLLFLPHADQRDFNVLEYSSAWHDLPAWQADQHDPDRTSIIDWRERS